MLRKLRIHKLGRDRSSPPREPRVSMPKFPTQLYLLELPVCRRRFAHGGRKLVETELFARHKGHKEMDRMNTGTSTSQGRCAT